MNRKLHNSLMAVLSSSSLLAAGWLAGAPLPGPTTAHPAGIAEHATAPGTNASVKASPARRAWHSVAMPFFSFAPRG